MEDLANMALALALTRTMLSLPYRADTAEDLERAVRVAIRAASLSRHLMASSHLFLFLFIYLFIYLFNLFILNK